MKTNFKLFTSLIGSLACVLILSVTGSAQLLINEVEADPGDQQNDSCQYVEVRGTPGATVPANTYFVAIDSDSNNPGVLFVAVNLGGTVIGSNGIIYIINTIAGLQCPGRTPAAGTTVVSYSSPIRIGGGNLFVGSESFAILQTTTAITAGQDRDVDDDGVLDFNPTYLDGVAFIINPDEQFVYPPNSAVLGTPFADQPDAFTRFPGNNTPFSPAAFYYGEISATPPESTAFEGPLSPNFPTGGQLTPGAPNGPTTLAPAESRADFDGDGKTDLSVFRSAEATWYVQRSIAGFQAARFGQSSDVLAPGDYDGDGKADFAVFRENGFGDPNRGYFFVLNSADNTVRSDQFGRIGDVPVTGDYDGDGKDDLAVYRNGASAADQSFFYFRPSGTAGVNFTTQPWGRGGDRAVGGNFDGDGKDDFAVFRPSDSVWYVQKSTGGFTAQQWGVNSDTLVPADYDGDGKDDLAVFRSSTNLWYILRSGNGAAEYISFGQAGDALVPGDYDGDGKDDLAVYRNGNWFINLSTSGFATFTFGNGSDKPVPAEYLP